MRKRAQELLGEALWGRLALLALDAAGLLLGARAWAGLWLAAVFTVRWDPLGRSQEPVPLRGRCRYARFRVAAAPTEYERRAVACFYRWHASPSEADWRASLPFFGLAAPPDHVLRFEGPASPAAPPAATLSVESISLPAAPARGRRTLRLAGSELVVAGPAPIGGFTPESFLREVGLKGA